MYLTVELPVSNTFQNIRHIDHYNLKWIDPYNCVSESSILI